MATACPLPGDAMLPHVALQQRHNPILSSDDATTALPFSSGATFPFTSRDAFYHDDLPLALTLGRATISDLPPLLHQPLGCLLLKTRCL